MDRKHLLAYITGTVDQELLRRHASLVTENRLLRNQIQGRLRLSDDERQALAEIGQKLGKKALEEVATIVTPDTILAWHRTLVAQKCDSSKQRKPPGPSHDRPKGPDSLEATIRTLNVPLSLPVLTLADPALVLASRDSAARVAMQVLEYLLDLDHFRGVRRLFVP